MTSRHYDAIVLGRSPGALAVASLLSRRDLRVLLLGQGQKPATYHFEGRSLRRRAFTFLSASTPAFRRLLHELAQTQTFRRLTRSVDPMFAVLGDGFRLEVPPNIELFVREIDREFPEVRQVVEEMYATFANVNAAADTAFEKDTVLPPGTFWERFETGRAVTGVPLVDGDAEALLGKFPVGHPYRDVTSIPAQFASDLAPDAGTLPAFALARLHGSWTRGVSALSGGEDELESFLIERVRAHGGECKLDQRAASILVRGRAVAGVFEDGHEDPTSTDVLVADLPGEALADLSRGEGVTKSAERDWPRLTAPRGRFVTSLVVKTAGLPEALPEESFLLPRKAKIPDPRRPVVRLQRIPAPDPAHPGETLLVAEALVPKHGAPTLLEAREAILSSVFQELPFLSRHLVLVDSAHDGLPLHDYSSGARKEIDRIHVVETSPGPEPMQWLWVADPPGYLGLAGEPIRGPIPGTYLVGSTVLPALGQEGQLIAALSAARLIARRNRSRQRMRREMWTKIETG